MTQPNRNLFHLSPLLAGIYLIRAASNRIIAILSGMAQKYWFGTIREPSFEICWTGELARDAVAPHLKALALCIVLR